MYCNVDSYNFALKLEININRISNMRIKTLFLSLAVTLLASMSTLSASAADYVKVSDKDGKDTYFALSEKPTVTFTSTAMILTAGSQTVEYSLTDFRAFAFADQPTGIGTLDAESNNAVFSFGNSLKGEGLKAGSQVAVYTINGQLVGRATVSQSGSVEIPLDGQTGVFVVKSLSKTFKFIRK